MPADPYPLPCGATGDRAAQPLHPGPCRPPITSQGNNVEAVCPLPERLRSYADGFIDAECAFCDVVSGAAESSRVYEDEWVLAFMDIQPVTSGHLLVVPRNHVADLATLDEALGANMFRVALRLAGALRRSGLRCEGVNLFLADGAAAFQEVFHTHLHVVPRYPGDSFQIDADWRVRDRDELNRSAAQVPSGLQ
jgi:histidine triad (HIT) family protein